MVKIYSQYNHPVSEGIEFTEPSMAQQQFKDESDINNLVDRNMRYKDPAFVTKLQLSGKLNTSSPIYGDFSEVSDYQHSLAVIENAQAQFNSLPSKVRARFNNNPAEMLDFCSNSANYEEGVSLGLFEKNVEIENLKLEKFQQEQLQKVENPAPEAISTPIGETSAQQHT